MAAIVVGIARRGRERAERFRIRKPVAASYVRERTERRKRLAALRETLGVGWRVCTHSIPRHCTAVHSRLMVAVAFRRCAIGWSRHLPLRRASRCASVRHRNRGSGRAAAGRAAKLTASAVVGCGLWHAVVVFIRRGAQVPAAAVADAATRPSSIAAIAPLLSLRLLSQRLEPARRQLVAVAAERVPRTARDEQWRRHTIRRAGVDRRYGFELVAVVVHVRWPHPRRDCRAAARAGCGARRRRVGEDVVVRLECHAATGRPRAAAQARRRRARAATRRSDGPVPRARVSAVVRRVQARGRRVVRVVRGRRFAARRLRDALQEAPLELGELSARARDLRAGERGGREGRG